MVSVVRFDPLSWPMGHNCAPHREYVPQNEDCAESVYMIPLYKDGFKKKIDFLFSFPPVIYCTSVVLCLFIGCDWGHFYDWLSIYSTVPLAKQHTPEIVKTWWLLLTPLVYLLLIVWGHRMCNLCKTWTTKYYPTEYLGNFNLNPYHNCCHKYVHGNCHHCVLAEKGDVLCLLNLLEFVLCKPWFVSGPVGDSSSLNQFALRCYRTDWRYVYTIHPFHSYTQ